VISSLSGNLRRYMGRKFDIINPSEECIDDMSLSTRLLGHKMTFVSKIQLFQIFTIRVW